MEHSTARDSAVAAVTGWQSNGTRTNFKETPVRQLFGVNVFSDDVMRARLPEHVYKAIRNTIKRAYRLADKAPVEMKMENGHAMLNLERPIFDPMATVVVVEFDGDKVERVERVR